MFTVYLIATQRRFHIEISTFVVMVEVSGLIVQRSVFLAGETVFCEIRFINKGHGPCNCQPKNGIINGKHESYSSCKRHSSRHLAWASAQIHCQCHVNESKVKLKSNKLEQESYASTKSTSFMPMRGEKGHSYLATKPKILFCNLELKSGQCKSFLYSDKVPITAPPSYPGQLVRFSYKVTIGIGRIHAPTCLLKLPIRVLSCEESLGKLVSSSSEQTKGNPFLEEESLTDHSLLDVFVDYVSSSTSRRNKNTYNIWSTNGSVGKFSLPKLNYRVGEDIVGTFDFSQSAVKCIKYIACLESEETVHKEYLQERQVGRNKPTITIHSRTEECCCNCRISYFSLHIPMSLTPGFTSEIVSIRWKLHFEFTTAKLDEIDELVPFDQSLNDTKNSQTMLVRDSVSVPDTVSVETMTWDLPLQVFSTNPDQVALSSPSTAKAVILLK